MHRGRALPVHLSGADSRQAIKVHALSSAFERRARSIPRDSALPVLIINTRIRIMRRPRCVALRVVAAHKCLSPLPSPPYKFHLTFRGRLRFRARSPAKWHVDPRQRRTIALSRSCAGVQRAARLVRFHEYSGADRRDGRAAEKSPT